MDSSRFECHELHPLEPEQIPAFAEIGAQIVRCEESCVNNEGEEFVMKIGKRISLVFGVVAVASGSAFGDAFAAGQAAATMSLYNFGSNTFGGTCSDITMQFFKSINVNFSFTDGPGTFFSSQGGGTTYVYSNPGAAPFGGFGADEGVGAGWQIGGSNDTSNGGFTTDNSGYSDASNTIGSINASTEDTYNEVIYKITNNSAHTKEFFDVLVDDGFTASVSLDNSGSEFGVDRALLEFGVANSSGNLTGISGLNFAYAETGNGDGMNFGSDLQANVCNPDYSSTAAGGPILAGKSVYFAVITENYSATYSAVPSPAAVAPFVLGLVAAARRRKKA